MFAGGDFSQVRNATGQATFDRDNLFSFNATSGAVNNVHRCPSMARFGQWPPTAHRSGWVVSSLKSTV